MKSSSGPQPQPRSSTRRPGPIPICSAMYSCLRRCASSRRQREVAVVLRSAEVRQLAQAEPEDPVDQRIGELEVLAVGHGLEMRGKGVRLRSVRGRDCNAHVSRGACRMNLAAADLSAWPLCLSRGGASLEPLLGEWEPIPEVTDAEREVADLLPIDASPDEARAALERVPLWFHTFLLSRQRASTRRASPATTATGSRSPRELRGTARARRGHVRRLLRVPGRAPRRRARARCRQRAVRPLGRGALGQAISRAARASARSLSCSARASSTACRTRSSWIS